MTAVRILFILSAILIVSLHIGSVLCKKKLAEILTYVNLGLHIALIFELLALEVSFEFMALTFMLSLLVYLSASFVSYKIGRKEDKKE